MITKVKELIVNATTSKEYIEYVKYHENNILSITKVSRWELVHSNYIAWILNPYETHGLGFYPICRFLQMLCNLGIERFPAVHSTDIFCDEHKIRDVEIIREQPVPTNGQNKRSTQKIDLLIKVKFEDGVLPIVIENKVGSGENGRNNDQTVDYFHWGETVLKSAFDPIYLCLVPLFNNIAPACPNFFVINYQHMVDNIIEPCMWRTNNAWTRDTIKIYLQCLSYQNDNEKGHNTMAISSEERKILDNFIQNNRIFIDSLLDIFADGATEEEKKAIAKVKTAAKDYSSFEFNGQSYRKSHLASAVIKQAINDGLITSYSVLEQKFSKIGKKNNIVRKVSDIKDKSRYDYFSEFDLSGIQFGITNQWEKAGIEDFIEVASREFGYSIRIS